MLALVAALERGIESRIIGLPDAVTFFEFREVDLAVLQKNPRPAHFVDATALFMVGVASGVEDDAIAVFQGGVPAIRLELDPVGPDLTDATDVGAAFFAEAGVNEFLIVDAIQPAGGKAAGKDHLEGITILVGRRRLCSGLGRVDRLPIGARHRRDILGSLEAAFDFKTRHPESDQFGNLIDPREILRREQVTLIAHLAGDAVDDEFVGHAAGLGALAAIGAALPERFTGEALARVGDAEGAVDKGLDLDRTGIIGMKKPDLAQRIFPRDDRPVEIEEAVGKGEGLGRCNRHLRRGVEMEIGHHRPRHRRESEILHDDGVNAARTEVPQLLRRVLELGREDERVKGDKSPHPVAVEESHQLRQILVREVVRPNPCVETGHAEIDRIGPVRHRGAGALPVAGGCE